MSNVLLVMRRRVLAQSLIRSTSSSPAFGFRTEFDPSNAALTAIACSAEVAVVEAAESGDDAIEQSLEVCDRIHAGKPDCKLLLLCPGNNCGSRSAAVLAKRQNRIDDFIFDDTSLEYLISKLESMLNGGS